MLRLALASTLRNVLRSRNMTHTVVVARRAMLQQPWTLICAFHASPTFLAEETGNHKHINTKAVLSTAIVPDSELQYKVIEFKNGDIYDGFTHNNRMHGQGTLVYSTGETLAGEFRAGAIYTGKGRRMHNAKHTTYYDGDILEGKMHGHGTHKTTAFTYTGGWQHGKRHGTGMLTFSNGQVFQGEFRDSWIVVGGGAFVSNRREPMNIYDLHEPPPEMRCSKVRLVYPYCSKRSVHLYVVFLWMP